MEIRQPNKINLSTTTAKQQVNITRTNIPQDSVVIENKATENIAKINPSAFAQSDPLPKGVLEGRFDLWKHEDVKGLDMSRNEYKLNDGFDDSRDLAAVYAHEGRPEDPYCFRADYFDLAAFAENNNLNTYFLLSFDNPEVKGKDNLPDSVPGKTDRPWQLAVCVYDSNSGRVFNAANDETTGIKKTTFEHTLDSMQFAIDKDKLRELGWKDGQTLHIQAFTTKDFNSQITDTISTNITKDGKREEFKKPWDNDGVLTGSVSTTSQAGTGKLAFILHANQSIKPTEESKTHISYPDGTGFKRALDSAEYWKQPLEIHVSGTSQANFAWASPEFNERIREDVKKGLVDIEGGVFDEHLMPPFEGEVNQKSLLLGKEEAEFYGKEPTVGWTPERVASSKTLEDMKKTGYKGTITDFINKWYKPADEDDKNRIHKFNGVNVMFIDRTVQYNSLSSTDGGMETSIKEKVLSKAASPDQDQLLLGMWDWEEVGGHPFWYPQSIPHMPDDFDKTLRYAANHPWIEVTTPTRAIQNIKPKDHDNEELPIQSYLQEVYGDENFMDNWYYGKNSNKSYYDLVLRERGWDFGVTEGDFLPNNKKLGDLKTPGTIIHDSWQSIKQTPDNSLKKLAEKTFMAGIFETAWHDTTGSPKEISGWQRNIAGLLRQVTNLTYAANWAEDVKQGKVSPKTKIEVLDIDQDGVKEYVLKNDKLLAIFDRVGGRLVNAVTCDDKGPVSVIGTPLNESVYEGEAEVDKFGRYTKVSSFRDSGHDDNFYSMRIEGDNSIVLISDDQKIAKKITLPDGAKKLTASYTVSKDIPALNVLFGLSPNYEDLLVNGQKNLEETGSPTGDFYGIENQNGGKAIVRFGDTKFTGQPKDRTIAMTQKVQVTGKERFNVELEF